MTTLRKALTQAKCSVPCKLRPRNTRSSDWPKLRDGQQEQLYSISTWEEFTIANLNASYGDILDQHIPGGLDVADPTELATMEIKSPQHINHLIKWSDGVLGPTLECARRKKSLQPGTILKRDLASPENSAVRPGLLNRNNKGRTPADHLIELDQWNLSTLVVGLGRPSKSFPGRHLANGGIGHKEAVWPLRQLANLCYHSKTRFGYILTDTDLVVCCFSAEDLESTAPKWSVAIMPVAWTKAGEAQLTTDLALWWLCMLAISGPHNRRLTKPEHMTRIDEWTEPKRYDDERGWVRRHKYSNFEEPTDEPLPPAYESPLPGNVEGMAAVFLAEVGINAEPDFNLVPAGDNGVLAGAGDYLHNFDFNVFPGPNHN